MSKAKTKREIREQQDKHDRIPDPDETDPDSEPEESYENEKGGEA
jgi:hypothetical protein